MSSFQSRLRNNGKRRMSSLLHLGNPTLDVDMDHSHDSQNSQQQRRRHGHEDPQQSPGRRGRRRYPSLIRRRKKRQPVPASPTTVVDVWTSSSVIPALALDPPSRIPLLPRISGSRHCSQGQLLPWLETTCPSELLPKFLAYCGPQTTAALYGTNRFWHGIISDDYTWRILCEDLNKWKEGDPEPNCSWREFYCRNPCVPMDYSSMNDAMTICQHSIDMEQQQQVSLREHLQEPAPHYQRTIWLRPGDYQLEETLVVNQDHAQITVATMQRGGTRKTASLILNTTRRNKPLVHIASGHLSLDHVRLGHYSSGTNLWNGNAAVQIQPLPVLPPLAAARNNTPPTSLPSISMNHVEVISHSGRGLVNNDGGNVTIRHSYIHDCAATGIYVGSSRCQLTMTVSDLVSNGHGNRLNEEGVTRGHSGFYLEQGHAKLIDCNISNNSSCGISVSNADSMLTMHNSDVVANGLTQQLEVASWQTLDPIQEHHHNQNNHIATTGLVKVRSRLGLTSVSHRGSESSEHGQEEEEDPGDEDDHEVRDNFVVAEENVRFGDLIEI